MKRAMKSAGAVAGGAALMPAMLMLAASPALADGGSKEPPVSVTVTGLRSTKGQLVACLWSQKAGFPVCDKNSGIPRVVAPISGTTVRLSFPAVAPGQYVVVVYHDEDSDGKMKRNFIGMPQEGVGVSNNPAGRPSFEKAQFRVDAGRDAAGRAIAIKLRYL